MLSFRRFTPVLAGVGFLMLSTAGANAVPVNVQFSSALSFVQDLGTANDGDIFTLSFVVENGGSGLVSQAWDQSNIVDVATLGVNGSVGTAYTVNYGVSGLSFALTTDAFGAVASAIFSDPFGDNSDSAFAVGGGDVSFINLTGISVVQSHPEGNAELALSSTVDNWSVSLVDVPEPGALALLGIGLIGLGTIRVRRHVFS